MLTPITADIRGLKNHGQELVSGLVLRTGSEVLINRLPWGDLWWATDIGISYGVELKTVQDLYRSLYSKDKGNRLEKQLSGLRTMVQIPILGISGLTASSTESTTLLLSEPLFHNRLLSAYQVAETRISTAMLDGALWSYSNPTDGLPPVQVIWRNSKEQLLDAIAVIYKWSEKAKHGTFQRHLPTGSGKNQDLNVLMLVPGLGEERAKALLSTFGTAVSVLSADVKVLQGVQGVGPKLAGTIKSFWKSIGGT